MRAAGKLILIFLGGLTTLADDVTFFRDKVQPILESRCYECHSHQSGKMKGGLTLDSRSGWQAGGEKGAVIVPGDLDKSLLIKAVRRLDPDLQMPPKRALPENEIAVLEQWVKSGAYDPREPVVATQDTNWWSLKPLVRPKVPAGARNPIDAFLTNETALETSRRSLIRRLFFDLHGLPPTYEEVKNFDADPDPDAYPKLVDRLLDSPRYGEHWARHWLDAIHFADTHGFEHDLIRSNAWVYRDYVIGAFNRDVSWGRFIREQLAADVLFPNEPRLTAALGFLGAGPWDHSTAQTAPVTSDYLDRDDMVTQTLSTFASATVHCARCHDHKFDPISQKDYYALQAVFAGVGKGDIAFDSDKARTRERRHWKDLLTAAEARDARTLLTSSNATLVAEWEKSIGKPASWKNVEAQTFLTASSANLKRLADGSFISEGPRPETDSYSITIGAPLPEITAIRLELISDPGFPKNGPGRTDNGNLHLSEFEILRFAPGVDKPEKISVARATSDFDQEGWTIAHAIDGKEKTAWGIFPRVGENHIAVFELKSPLTLSNNSRLVIQLKQLHGGGHVIGKFRLSITDDALSRTRILPSNVVEALATSTRSENQRLNLAAHALKEIAASKLAALPTPTYVFGAAPQFRAVAEGFSYNPWSEPKVVHVLNRGDINKPGSVAEPGAISAIQIPFNHVADRRAALADWLAHTNNPLTWRSAVNRVWHHHFGRGIVDSLNDFGRMGSQPTNPELLDWLACEFRDQGGSLKSLHRLILTSQAYRGARLQRLDAETFRDAVLSASGRLDLTMGGPGVQQFKLGKPIQLTPTVDYEAFEWSAPGANRRSIYRFVYRGLQDPFMEALDFPDAAQLAPTRPFSVSPLQSLALLNNDFVLFHSEALAKRAGNVRNAFRCTLQRDPDEEEYKAFTAYAEKHGLAAACRLLFNSNEFLFVN